MFIKFRFKPILMKVVLVIQCVIVLLISACNPPVAKIDSSKVADEKDYFNVAILLMDGVYNTEFTAPYDIFQHTIFRESIKPMKVFSIAQNLKIITTFEGMRVLPDYSYLEDYPAIDILVVPSAEHHLDSDLENEEMLNFVREAAENSLFVTSHCDGSFVLAKAGLLDSVDSTTFPGDLEAYKEMFPNLDVCENVLFVHDGKYITSAGGAKSFEAALYLVEHMYGKEIADQIAKGMVIDWDLAPLNYWVK